MENKEENFAKLIDGPVGRVLFKMTVPMIFGMVGIVAFNLVDTFFVGRLGTQELAAITFTFPIILIINSLTLGVGMGTTVTVSRAIGRNDKEKTRQLTTASIILASLTAILFIIVGELTIRPVFHALGASADMIFLIKQYMVIWYLGAFFVVIPMVGNSAIRATGDTKTPSLIMLASVGVNIILDPLLIFGLFGLPRLGLAGAAIATVISRAITMVLAFWVVYYREKLISISSVAGQKLFSAWKSVLHIGLPTAASRLIMPVAFGFITRLIAGYGAPAVAAFGVGSRIDFFALAAISALASVISPFVGQNWTAGERERVKTGLKYADQFSLVFGAIMFLFFIFFGGLAARLFSPDIKVISLVKIYLWIIPISYGLQGVLAMSTSALNSLKKSWISSGLSLGVLFFVYLPLAYLGSVFFGLIGIFAAAVPAYGVGALASYLVVRFYLSRLSVA